jgi:transposase-like protein
VAGRQAHLSAPRRGGKHHSFLTTRRIWKCTECRKQFSVKVGTIFEDSPLGLDTLRSASIGDDNRRT